MLGRGEEAWASFVAALTDWARENRIATLFFDPNVGPESELGRALRRPPWQAASQLGEPRCHVVDLLPEPELWTNLRRKHREAIHRAERANVGVVCTDGRSQVVDADIAMDHFQRVQREIAQRIGVPLMSPDYYRLLWNTFWTARRAHLATASIDGKPVGAMLHLTCGNDMLWFAGGQTAEGAPLGISKLLVWRSMVRAGELGMRRYNMWGTATEGLAHFKSGFGAREENYIGTRSLAINGTVDRLIRVALRARQLGRRFRRY
jgi:lipid II:glycine glycyltransferase (peptidoglycan interpeptide bridge formation enzyme)